MNKIEEIKKMFDYLNNTKYQSYMDQIIKKSEEDIYTINSGNILSPLVDFNMGDYDHWWCKANFNKETLTMTTCKVSGHNGDYYGEEHKTLPLSKLEEKYDQIKSLFFSAVDWAIKKEKGQKELEAKNAIIENRMKQILNGIE